jgi:hypothetical protein
VLYISRRTSGSTSKLHDEASTSVTDPVLGSGVFLSPGSWINIPDTQHWHHVPERNPSCWKHEISNFFLFLGHFFMGPDANPVLIQIHRTAFTKTFTQELSLSQSTRIVSICVSEPEVYELIYTVPPFLKKGQNSNPFNHFMSVVFSTDCQQQHWHREHKRMCRRKR